MIPFELTGIDVQRDGGVAEQLVANAVPAGLGLAGAEIDQPQLGIVGARDPGIGARPLAVRHVAPGVAARFAGIGDGGEFPDLAAVLDVIGGDEAAVQLRSLVADTKPQNELAIRDHHAADLVPAVIGNLELPVDLAGARVERIHGGVAGGIEKLVAIQRHGARGRIHLIFQPGPQPVFPDQVAGRRVQRLHRVVDDGRNKHHAVMHQGGDLLAFAILHRPYPAQLQIVHILGGDLLQRRMAPAGIILVVHQPVGGGRIQHHLFGDGRVVFDRSGKGDAGADGNAAGGDVARIRVSARRDDRTDRDVRRGG